MVLVLLVHKRLGPQQGFHVQDGALPSIQSTDLAGDLQALSSSTAQSVNISLTEAEIPLGDEMISSSLLSCCVILFGRL